MHVIPRRTSGLLAGAACLALLWAGTTVAQDGGFGNPEVTDPRAKWIHEDIEAGYEQAKATGKPLLVAFR